MTHSEAMLEVDRHFQSEAGAHERVTLIASARFESKRTSGDPNHAVQGVLRVCAIVEVGLLSSLMGPTEERRMVEKNLASLHRGKTERSRDQGR